MTTGMFLGHLGEINFIRDFLDIVILVSMACTKKDALKLKHLLD